MLDSPCYDLDCVSSVAGYRCEFCMRPQTRLCDEHFKKMRSSEFVHMQKCSGCQKRGCIDLCLSAPIFNGFKFCKVCYSKIPTRPR